MKLVSALETFKYRANIALGHITAPANSFYDSIEGMYVPTAYSYISGVIDALVEELEFKDKANFKLAVDNYLDTVITAHAELNKTIYEHSQS